MRGREAGFTLIEILVAVLIIGILLGAAMFSFEADKLRVDAGSAGLRMLQFFEHDTTGAVAQNEAIAVDVERPACRLRVVVPRRHRPGGTETGHSQRRRRVF